jgi:hypothetical protein
MRSRHAGRLLQGAAVLQIGGDASRPKTVIADLGLDAGRFRMAADHRMGILLGQGGRRQGVRTRCRCRWCGTAAPWDRPRCLSGPTSAAGVNWPAHRAGIDTSKRAGWGECVSACKYSTPIDSEPRSFRAMSRIRIWRSVFAISVPAARGSCYHPTIQTPPSTFRTPNPPGNSPAE